MDDFNNTGFDLVLSDDEKEKLLKHFTDQAYQEFLDELPSSINAATGKYPDGYDYDEMFWSGIQFENSKRMFDLCICFDDGKVVVDVFQCDWIRDNWQTNTRHSWRLLSLPIKEASQ